VSLYNQQKGLPADLDNHVFKIKNKIVFATTAGIYEYDAVANKMIAAKEYADIVGPRPLRYLKEDVDGNIWFVQDKMVGVADYSGAKPVIHYIPELKNKILSGFENIFPFNSENILAGSESGFYHINYKRYRESIKPIAAYLTLVKIMGRSGVILFGGHSSPTDSNEKTLTIPYWHNSLHFEYTASLINLHTHLEFSYYLKGFDDAWSNWSTLAEKDYTNLPSGSYTLHIKARNSPSNESEAYIYSFTIKPPWHQTLWAYALYVLLFGIIMFVIFRFQARKHKRRQEAVKKQLTYQHQLELEKTEKELIRLKNEKLEAAIEHKNAELASATMNLVQKKEFILKLKTELQQLQKRTKVGEDNPELKKLIKVLSEEEKSDEEWNIFSQHFDSVFGDFITILKNKFPSLKPHELRLCAYLRMNLNSKEIAPLMSISLRGVEISRYRLRKKLDLTSDVNLVQFLMDLK
jgi:DNA-binding CsgD family transcriptional regulator